MHSRAKRREGARAREREERTMIISQVIFFSSGFDMRLDEMRKNDKPNIVTPHYAPSSESYPASRDHASMSQTESKVSANVVYSSVWLCVSRVEINKDKSSISSPSDRWFTTKECNWTGARDATNKTMSHSSELQSCLKFYSHAITERRGTSCILFATSFIWRGSVSLVPFISEYVIQGNEKNLV